MPAADNFTWTHKTIVHTTSTDTAFLNASGLALPAFSIVAGYPRSSYSMLVRVQFVLTSFNTGTYNITTTAPGAPNAVYYIDDDGFNLQGNSGTVTITANSNNKISGNFSVTVTNGSANTALTGNFTDMPVK
ncbi:DUF6252 domain-containing protein [Ferruginibacter sp.]